MIKQPKVLIIDDDPKLLKMLKRTLSYEGLEVITASNGLEALPLVSSESPQLIILDWLMPKMDGLEATRAIRKLERNSENHTHIVALTAAATLEDRQKCFDSGMDDVLTKPLDINKLKLVIKKI